MSDELCIVLSRFDFDFWTSTKMRILLLLSDRESVGDIRSLSMLLGLSYAATYEAVLQLEDRGLLVRESRSVRIVPSWRQILSN